MSSSSRQEKSSGFRWLEIFGVIIGIIASCIAIYQFAAPSAAPPTPTPRQTPVVVPSPTRKLSFLEMVTGNYTLNTWTPANRPIELGVKITQGTLKVGSNGIADWTVQLEQSSTSNPGKAQMTARGQIQLDNQQMAGVQGGEFNNTKYLDAKSWQIGRDVELAVRGWSTGSGEDRFTLSLDAQSSGKQLLQMRNSRNTFVWIK